jgi:YtcA family
MRTTERDRSLVSARRGLAPSILIIAAGLLPGCRPAPDITVAGSYFPSWMASLVLGVLGTILFWQLFTRLGIDPYLGPRALVYVALVILLTLVIWQSVFRG